MSIEDCDIDDLLDESDGIGICACGTVVEGDHHCPRCGHQSPFRSPDGPSAKGGDEGDHDIEEGPS